MFKNVFIFFICVLFFGCLRFPRSESKVKSQMLEDKGYHQKSEQIKRESVDQPEINLDTKTFKDELQDDGYYSSSIKFQKKKEITR